jgi:hypothetical protein
MLAATTHAMAQNTTQQISIQRDSVPVTTIVPVEQPPYTSTDSIAQAAPPPEKFLSRREQRAERARLYAFSIDSLVATRSFAFYPTAMQAVPDGEIRMVYADYFYAYFSPVMVEVHLPMERGTMRQISIINFDSSEMEDFASAKFQTQWNISFSVDDRGKKYDFALVISTVTGQTELTIESPDGAMRYIGSVGQRTRER